MTDSDKEEEVKGKLEQLSMSSGVKGMERLAMLFIKNTEKSQK